MPELPEAETIARGLVGALRGRRIRDAQVLRADVVEGPARAFRASVRGRTIRGVERRGKKVLIRLDAERLLVVNLGMTGRLFALVPDGPRPAYRPTHPAVRFRLERGGSLVFDDIRRFGKVACLPEATWEERSLALGPEPLSAAFTAGALQASLATSKSPVRSWLLDQRRVAGVGNIYANEALWHSRIHPRRPAADLSAAEARGLRTALRSVLRKAVEARGTTLRDYRTAEGESGGFARTLAAYGREGSPCPRCSTPIERLVFGGRSAFLCPSCQPEDPYSVLDVR